MQNSKLIQLLKILEPGEIKDFPKFLKSPFFNSNKQCVSLLNHLLKYYPTFDARKITKEQVYKKIFPGKPFNYHILGNLMSKLAALTEEYLSNLQFQKEDFAKKKMLGKAYSDRKNCYDFYQKNNEALIRKIKNQDFENINIHEELRWLYHDYYFHPITNRQTIRGKGITKALDHLELFYVQKKLLYLLELKSRSHLFGEDYSALLSDVDFIGKEKPVWKDDGVSLTYLQLLKLYEEVENEKIFTDVKNLFYHKNELIGKAEKSIILLHLLNYCIRLINKGEVQYFKESLELYKIGLTFDAFIEQKRMSEVTFSNIVSVSARCGEFAWANNFIMNFKQYLDEEEREDARLLSLAFLKFTQKEFSKAIDLLLNHVFEKPLLIIKSKTLLVRSYFELFLKDDSFFDLLIAQTFSFEKYIRRSKDVSKEKSIAYLDFIKYTRRIVNGIIDKNITKDLLEKIASSGGLTYKSWLLEKAHYAMGKR